MLQETINKTTSPDFKRFLNCYADLSPKERIVMEQRFIEGKSLNEIADCHGITNERIRQIVQNIQRKISVKSKKK